MTFPTPGALLDLRTELLLNGTWTDSSDYTFNNGDFPGARITRGRPDESSQASPSALVLGLNNADGRFTARNPAGAYYPNLVKNTQVRVSVPEGASYLRCETDDFSFASTPDSAGLSITGDTEVQVDVTLDNWNAAQVLASKWTASGNERSWILMVNEDGTLTFSWSSDGSAIHTVTSTQPVPYPALRRMAVKATVATASGQVKFYTAATIGGSYTQLGSATSRGAAAVFDSTAVVRVGAPGATVTSDYSDHTGILGKVHGFRLLSGIAGTVKASPDFTTQTAGATSFSDAQGNTWTLQGNAELSDRDYRFHGEVASWPQTWDPTGTYVSVSVTANGLLRRLGQSSKPIRSALYRYWMQLTSTSAPVAYWSFEDGNKASGFASPLPGVQPATVTSGTPSAAADSTVIASDPLPQYNKAIIACPVPGYSDTTGTAVLRFVTVVPESLVDNINLAAFTFAGSAYGNTLLTLQTGLGGGLSLILNSSVPLNLATVTMNLGTVYMVDVEFSTGGGNVTPVLKVSQPGGGTNSSGAGTAQAGTLGRLKSLELAGDSAGSAGGVVIGHVALQTTLVASSDYTDALNAHAGEAAGDRFSRLCAEQSIAFRGQGQLSATTPMGPQIAATLSSLLQDCVSADQGILAEPRQCFGLGYRTRGSLQNQAAAITLDYAGADLAGTLSPADDDQYTQNDVTVSRVNGSSRRRVLTSGPLSTQDPPDGVSTYDVAFTLNLQSDSQCADAAGWLLNLGTADEQRFPLVQVNLARTEVSDIYDDLRHLDLGDLFQIANPPSWLPPDTVSQLAAQFSETLGGFIFEIDPTGIPAAPYQVFEVGDATLGRIGTDGSSLHSSCTSGATSLSVDSTGALWTTADVPFDIAIGGERITVTAVSGSSSPQTFTVTRSVNGVVAAHGSAADVSLFTKPVLAW